MGIRYIASCFKSFLLFGFKNKKVYIGRGVILKGNIKLSNNIKIYDNSKIVGACTIGEGVRVCENSEIRTNFSTIDIGANTTINRNSLIIGKVSIGDDCLIAPNVVIVGSNHVIKDTQININKQGVFSKGIIINDNVWIGANVSVLDGVHIGEGVVVAAGAVVTKDIEPYTIVAGVPAIRIGMRV